MYNERRDKKVTLNTKNNPVIFDGRLLHLVNKVLYGTRFHLIVYKHFEMSSLTQSEFPIYDLAEFHPDSKPVNVLDADGYWIFNSCGLQEFDDFVVDFFFDNVYEDAPNKLKKEFNDKLKLTYLFMEGEDEVGLDNNRYVLGSNNLPANLVSTLTQNFMPVLTEINPKQFAHMHTFGLLFRTVGSKRQPIHIDGEHNNYFAIIPILHNYEDTYELFAMKVRLFVQFFFLLKYIKVLNLIVTQGSHNLGKWDGKNEVFTLSKDTGIEEEKLLLKKDDMFIAHTKCIHAGGAASDVNFTDFGTLEDPTSNELKTIVDVCLFFSFHV